MTPSWRHYFRAIWPGLRNCKSWASEVICLSPPSKAESMPAFRQAVWQCVEGIRAAGNCSSVWAEGRNRQRFFWHAFRWFQMKKNGQNLQVTFSTSNLITFVILPIFSNQTHFQKVGVQHINCTKQFLHKISVCRINQKGLIIRNKWIDYSYTMWVAAEQRMAVVHMNFGIFPVRRKSDLINHSHTYFRLEKRH